MTRSTLALLALATPALADVSATVLWKVTTDDGDALVEPGETATVTLSILMDADGAPLIALHAVNYDVRAGDNALMGDITGWDVPNDMDLLCGDPGPWLKDGNILCLCAGQLTLFGPFTTDNPVDVLEFQWKPQEYAAFEAQHATNMHARLDNMPALYVWIGEDKKTAESMIVAATEAAIAITVTGCDADINADGALDILDFIAFQLLWQDGDPAADCDGNGAFDVVDVVCFRQLFQKGCP